MQLPKWYPVALVSAIPLTMLVSLWFVLSKPKPGRSHSGERAEKVTKEIGGKKVVYHAQYEKGSMDIGANSIRVKVAKKSGDGTGVTPDKKRNEISIQNAKDIKSYQFNVKASGNPGDNQANLFQITGVGQDQPLVALGIKNGQLGLKVNGSDSQELGIKAQQGANVKVNMKGDTGTITVGGKTSKFDIHGGEIIAKYGIESSSSFGKDPIEAQFSH